MEVIEKIIVVLAIGAAAAFVAYRMVKKGGKGSCHDCSCGANKCSKEKQA